MTPSDGTRDPNATMTDAEVVQRSADRPRIRRRRVVFGLPVPMFGCVAAALGSGLTNSSRLGIGGPPDGVHFTLMGFLPHNGRWLPSVALLALPC